MDSLQQVDHGPEEEEEWCVVARKEEALLNTTEGEDVDAVAIRVRIYLAKRAKTVPKVKENTMMKKK